MKRPLKKHFAFFLIGFIFINWIFFFIIIGCHKEENKKTVKTDNFSFPDQEGWNSIVTTTTDGVLNAVVRYGHMQRFKRRKVVEFDKGVEIDFYNEKGEHTSKLISKKGKLNEATNDIEAFGNVVVVSDSGINLKTEHLWWDNSIEKVVSDEFVTITTVDQDTFYGYGFESDQYLDNWVIRKISGKARKGLKLDIDFSKKGQKTDSSLVDSTKDTEHSDSLKIDK